MSVAAVSMALRDHGRIGADTKRRVKAIAQRLGYKPDPALQALAAYRFGKRDVKVHSTIAFIIFSDARLTALRQKEMWEQEYASLRSIAGALGYSVDLIDLRSYERWDRVAELLQNRGVRGLVLDISPVPVSELKWDWNAFSVVTIFAQHQRDMFHRVTVDRLHAAQALTHHLRRGGYRRPGFTYPRSALSCEHDEWLWVFESAKHALGCARGPRDLDSVCREEEFREWLRREKPDVVVYLGSSSMLKWLARAGFSVPEQIGFCGLDLQSAEDPATGLYQNRPLLAAKAIYLLHTMLQANERGTVESSFALTIPGQWRDRNTLRVVG